MSGLNGPAEGKRVRHALLFIVLAGGLLRLYGLAVQSMWFDEGATLHIANYVDGHGSIFHADKNTEPPMISLLTWGWLRVCHWLAPLPRTSEASDFLIRLLPWSFGVLAIPLVFVTGRRLLKNGKAALTAAALFAVSPFHIYYAQELRVYSVYVCLSLGALYFLLRAQESGNAKHWLALVLCETLLMYSHFIAVWTLFLLNVYFLLTLPAHWPRARAWIASQAAAGMLILPALWQMFTAYAYVRRIEIPWYPTTTWKAGLVTFKDFFAGYSPATWAYWPLFLLAAVLFVFGIATLARRDRRAALLVALLAAGPITISLFMWSGRLFSFYEHRVFMFSGVVALYAVAAGLCTLRPRALQAAVATLFLLLTVPGLRDHYAHRLHPMDGHRLGVYDKGDFRNAAAYVNEHLLPGDLVCHASHFSIHSMRYYMNHPQLRIGAHDWDADVMRQTHVNEALLYEYGFMPVRVDIATAAAPRVWFVESTGITFEYKPHTLPVREWLDTHFERAEHREFQGLTVTLYVRKAAPERPAAAQGPPNVVFLLTDTLRADRLGAKRCGFPLTPHLDDLAARGVSFKDTTANCSWTKPSMASLFTSLHVDAHHVQYSARNEDPEHATSDVLPDSFETLAELLAGRGYDTFAVQTNANLTRVNGFSQGFREDRYLFSNGAPANWVTQRALEALDTLKPPFLLYAHYMDPHAPYEPPQAYRDMFGPAPELSTTDMALLSDFMAYYMDQSLTACGVRKQHELGDLSPQGKELVHRLYDGEVRFMDDQIGLLLDRVLSEFPNTIIIAAADHGEEFWEHGGMGHGTTLYEEQMRVPLLWAAPGIEPRTADTPAELIDILPTLAAQVGVSPNPVWRGKNLFADTTPATLRFGRTYGPWKELGLDLESALRAPDKLIRNNRDASHLLFRLDADPGETANAAAARPQLVEELSALLDTHRARNTTIATEHPATSATLDEETKARLESIGYLDSQ